MPNWYILRKIIRSNVLLNFILNLVLKAGDGELGGEEDVKVSSQKASCTYIRLPSHLDFLSSIMCW